MISINTLIKESWKTASLSMLLKSSKITPECSSFTSQYWLRQAKTGWLVIMVNADLTGFVRPRYRDSVNCAFNITDLLNRNTNPAVTVTQF